MSTPIKGSGMYELAKKYALDDYEGAFNQERVTIVPNILTEDERAPHGAEHALSGAESIETHHQQAPLGMMKT